MTLPEFFKKLDSVPDSEARKLVRQYRTGTGFAGQFYLEIVSRLGSNPLSAKKMASYWKVLDDSTESQFDMYRVRALFERTNGEWSKSAEAMITASNAAPSELQRWQCLVGAIDAFGRAGTIKRANSLAKSVVRKLVELGDPESAGRASINAGNALLWHDDYEGAQKWFLIAKEHLEGSKDEFARASAELGLSTCFLFTSTTKEASVAAQSAAQKFSDLRQPSYAALARVNEAHCLLRAGRADEARSLLLAIREGPLSEFDRARVEEFLGDAYLRLNLFEEALDAFGKAISSPAIQSLQMNRGNCELGIGDAYTALGQPKVAVKYYRSAEKLYAKFGNEIWASYAELRILQSRSNIDVGKVTDLARFFSKRRCRLFEVEALLIVARSKTGFATQSLKTAKARIQRWGLEHFRWQADHMVALSSTGARQLNAYRSMCKSIARARKLVSSRSGMVAFYRDKDGAMSEYLDLLLTSGTKANVEEAIRFISETRSQALLDEAHSFSGHLAPKIRERINELRLAIADTLHDDLPNGPARRISLGDAPAISMRRAWIELDSALMSHSIPPVSNSSDSLVYARGKESFYAIRHGVSHQLPISAEAISSAIRWLRFEMLEPLVDRKASQKSVEAIVFQLKQVLWDPFVGSAQIKNICPDDCLWQAPWQLFAAIDSMEFEIPISPWMSLMSNPTGNFAKKVGIWYFPHPELPLIMSEAEMFLSRFPDAVVCSTISEARSSLEFGDFDLLHIAGHSSLHRTNPMFSALSGQDGKLFAKEISTSKLKAKTVVLSACDTGATASRSRTEIDGMTRAFLARGAENVVATQWPLNDESAGIFMNEMYNELCTGTPMAKAIACARRQTKQEFAHPYYWGAPILYGGFSQ